MNTNLIEQLIKEQNYNIDKINVNKISVNYDTIADEYRIEVILYDENMERISFMKEYGDTYDGIAAFGEDLKAIGEIFQGLSKMEEDD